MIHKTDDRQDEIWCYCFKITELGYSKQTLLWRRWLYRSGISQTGGNHKRKIPMHFTLYTKTSATRPHYLQRSEDGEESVELHAVQPGLYESQYVEIWLLLHSSLYFLWVYISRDLETPRVNKQHMYLLNSSDSSHILGKKKNDTWLRNKLEIESQVMIQLIEHSEYLISMYWVALKEVS